MYEYLVILACLVGATVVSFGTNMIQLFKEAKQLQLAGKTPLTNRNIVVVGFAAVAEVVVSYLVLILCIKIGIEPTTLSVLLMFVGAYLLRNMGAYLTAWALWSIFVKIDRRKMMKEIEKDKEEALK